MTRTSISQRRGARSALWLALVAAAFALLLWSQPAAGQYGPTSSPPPRDYPDASSSPEAPDAAAPQTEVLRAAACLVGRDVAAAERLLATAPYSNEERSEAARFLRLAQRCLRSRDAIATSPLALRGAVAESLLETRFAELPPPRDPAVAAAPWFRPDAARARDDAATLAPVYALADCSAAHSPALARALLAAEPGAAAESEALSALGPVWNACAPPGAQLAFDRGSIRAVLAESLYRWSLAQTAGAAAPASVNP